MPTADSAEFTGSLRRRFAAVPTIGAFAQRCGPTRARLTSRGFWAPPGDPAACAAARALLHSNHGEAGASAHALC